MALRQRLLLQLAIVLILCLLVAAATVYSRAAGKIKTELHSALTVGEQVLIDAVKEIERSPSPYQQVRIIIERFSGSRHLRVTLLDNAGNRIASSRVAEPEEPAPDWFYHLIGGEIESTRVALPKNIAGYSALLMEADPRNEAQESWEDLGYVLSVLATLAVLASTLVYWTIGRELRPLEALNLAFAKLAEGNFSLRVAENGSRDLRAVNRAFNDMASHLEQSERAKVQLEEQLTRVQEEERAELARDLHDEIGPLLFSVGIDVASAHKALSSDNRQDTIERLDSIREAVSLSQKHVLAILGRLRSGTVEDLGLQAAINNLRDFWVARNPKLTFTIDVPDDGVGTMLDQTVYRVVQESVSNAIRHGQTGQIEIFISVDAQGATHVSVSDDGGGLRSERPGRGLTGMRERISALHGTLSVGIRPGGGGTRVLAELPAQHSAGHSSNDISIGGLAS